MTKVISNQSISMAAKSIMAAGLFYSLYASGVLTTTTVALADVCNKDGYGICYNNDCTAADGLHGCCSANGSGGCGCADVNSSCS